MPYQAHTGAPDYEGFAQAYKPFDLAAVTEQAMQFASNMTMQQEKIKQMAVETQLDQQLAPMKVATAKMQMDKLQAENRVFDLTHTPEKLQADFDVKQAKGKAEIAQADYAVKMAKHNTEVLALDENGTFAHIEDLAMNNPTLALEQINAHKADSDIAQNPMAMRRMNDIAAKARENLLSGNYDSLSMSQQDRDKADIMRFNYGKTALRGKFLASGFTPQQADEAVKAENDKIDNTIMAGLLGSKITKAKVSMKEGQAPELAVLSQIAGSKDIADLGETPRGWARILNPMEWVKDSKANWNDATQGILDKIQDELVTAKTSGQYDKTMVSEKIKKIKDLRSGWGWLNRDARFNTETGAKLDEYRVRFDAAKDATEKKAVLVEYANYLGQYSMNYNLELMKEQQRRAMDRAGVSSDTSTSSAPVAGDTVMMVDPSGVKRPIPANMVEEAKKRGAKIL